LSDLFSAAKPDIANLLDADGKQVEITLRPPADLFK
jgi:hypothetical protein